MTISIFTQLSTSLALMTQASLVPIQLSPLRKWLVPALSIQTEPQPHFADYTIFDERISHENKKNNCKMKVTNITENTENDRRL